MKKPVFVFHREKDDVNYLLSLFDLNNKKVGEYYEDFDSKHSLSNHILMYSHNCQKEIQKLYKKRRELLENPPLFGNNKIKEIDKAIKERKNYQKSFIGYKDNTKAFYKKFFGGTVQKKGKFLTFGRIINFKGEYINPKIGGQFKDYFIDYEGNSHTSLPIKNIDWERMYKKFIENGDSLWKDLFSSGKKAFKEKAKKTKISEKITKKNFFRSLLLQNLIIPYGYINTYEDFVLIGEKAEYTPKKQDILSLNDYEEFWKSFFKKTFLRNKDNFVTICEVDINF